MTAAATSQHGGHGEVAHREIEVGHGSDDHDPAGVEARLLPGLADGGRAGAGVRGLDRPAGEGDLAGVRAQARRALGEQDVGAGRTLAEQQEHGGAPVVAGRAGRKR